MKVRLRDRLKRLVQVREEPHQLALSFGMGVLLGILPGTGAMVAAGLAAVLRLNLPLAVAGAMVVNPLTAPLVYGGSYFLGRWMLGNQVIEHKIARILLTTIAGNFVLAAGMALVGYLLVWVFAAWHQARLRRKGKHAAGH